MSDDQKQPTEPAQAAQTPSSEGVGTKAGLALLGGLPGFIAGLAGAGWPGVIAMVLGGVGLVVGLSAIISKLNKMIDSRDQESAGADAGKTAVEIANQAAGNRQDMSDIRNQDPPTKPAQ
jgi:hypothetical protein